REYVGDEYVVMGTERIERFVKRDEITWDQTRSLMDQLVERVLAVGPGLTPVDGAGVVADFVTLERDMLAVALHGELLEVCGKTLEVLFVGQDGDGLRIEEVGIPDGEQSEQDGEISLVGRSAEVLVHLVKSVEHGAEVVGSDGQHGRKADGGIHGIAAADPVPEAEHVGGVD